MSQLLTDGDITPRITNEEYITRRKKLLEVLQEKSLAIIASADQQMMTDVVPYLFRQNGDYMYITGCTQPGGTAVLSEETGLCMFMSDTNKEFGKVKLLELRQRWNSLKQIKHFHLVRCKRSALRFSYSSLCSVIFDRLLLCPASMTLLVVDY